MREPIESLERRVLLDATVVGGLPTQPDNSLPNSLTVVGDRMFFTADAGGFGRELWVTDGTPQDTQLVKDINPGAGSSNPGQLTAAGNLLYFTVPGANNTAKLWRSDGNAAGTFEIDTPLFQSDSFVGVGTFLYFGGSAPGGDTEFWRTDGTPSGTTEIKQISHVEGYIGPMTVVNGAVQFAAQDDNHQLNLWQSDGTADGTKIVQTRLTSYPNNGPSDPNELGTVDSRSFFLRGSTLWTSDGTTQGTVAMKPFGTFSGLAFTLNLGSNPPPHVAFHHKLFFVADDGQTGFELWQSDGTPVGTTLFDDLSPGVVDASAPLPGATILSIPGEGPPDALTAANSKLFFTDPVYLFHSDLWVTDPGSDTATDIYAIKGGGQDAVYDLTPAGNRVFFERSVIDGLSAELGVTDGTAVGTRTLGEFPAFTIHNLNGNVVFGQDYIGISDGTAAGTTRLQLGMDLDFTQPSQPFISGSNAFFVTKDAPGYGNRGALWKTDATLTGTIQLTPVGANSYVYGVNLIGGGGVQFFVHDNATGSNALWVSDGTPQGTHPATTPPPPPSSPIGVAYNGLTYYAGDDGVHGSELFSTDGTAAGTKLVADINPGAGSSNPTSLAVARGLLYFNAYRPDVGNELWVTDGTATGTHLVQDLYPGPGSANPQQITDVRGTLYFLASDPLHRNALWKLPVGGPPNLPLNFSYLLTLAQHYGQQGTFATGDLNDDGLVNFDDLTLLAQNFGHPLAAAKLRPRIASTALMKHRGR